MLDKNFVMRGLDQMQPNPVCELNYNSNFELLVAVILSAQCTDKRVNQVTSELFKTHNTPEDFINIPLEELEQKIHACGFYHNKALSLKSMSYDIVEKFGGEVPHTFDELVTLRGVRLETVSGLQFNYNGGDISTFTVNYKYIDFSYTPGALGKATGIVGAINSLI